MPDNISEAERRTIVAAAVNLPGGSTRVSVGGRDCIMEDRRDDGDPPGALCPTEMVAAAVAG